MTWSCKNVGVLKHPGYNGGGKTPAAPDYTGAAIAQGEADLKAQQLATEANRIDQYTPWGSSTYSQAPGTFDQAGYDAAMAAYTKANTPVLTGYAEDGTPQYSVPRTARGSAPMAAPSRSTYERPGTWSQTTKLDPVQQQILDAQNSSELGMANTANAMRDRVDQATADPFTMDGAPEAGDSSFQADQAAQDALMFRMAPDLLRRRQAEEARLTAQGVGTNTNSEAWDRMQLERGRDETDAQMQAILKGYDVSNRQFDKKNAARANWTNEQTMLRDKPLNEMLALLRGTSVQTPQISPTFMQGSAAAPDLAGAMGAQYGAAMDSYNANAAQKSQNVGMASTVAMGAIML